MRESLQLSFHLFETALKFGQIWAMGEEDSKSCMGQDTRRYEKRSKRAKIDQVHQLLSGWLLGGEMGEDVSARLNNCLQQHNFDRYWTYKVL
jgi:hypothetical protein